MTSSDYWKVTVQFVPLNDLGADTFILQISAVQTERLCICIQLISIFESVQHLHTLDTQQESDNLQQN